MRRHLGDVPGDLVHPRCIAISRRNDGDLVHVRQRAGQRLYHLGHGGEQPVDHRRLVVLLIRLSLHVHGLRFRFAFLEDDFRFGLALRPDRRSMALGFRNQALLFGRRQRLDPLPLNLCSFEYCRDQFFFAAVNFGFLHFHLLLFLDLLHLHLLCHNLLLHDVGLDVIRLIGLCLLTFGDFQKLRSLDFQVALRFRLLGQRQSLRQHTLLVGLRFGDSRFPLRQRALDRGVAVSFCGSNVGIALDASHVRLAHVGDVLVFIANFLNGERNHLETHLVHVLGTGAAHAVGNHLRLLHDFFHGELADDAAQVAFHHQPDQAFALLVAFG